MPPSEIPTPVALPTVAEIEIPTAACPVEINDKVLAACTIAGPLFALVMPVKEIAGEIVAADTQLAP